MIEYVSGRLAELTPTTAIVDVQGLGYEVLISLNTYAALQGKAEARLWTSEQIREDAHLLFGFATREERALFGLLVSVNGVGPQTARTVLSAFTPQELAGIIQSEDAQTLKRVKGIGPKAAQRIVLELKDKVQVTGQGSQVTGSSSRSHDSAAVREAVGALTTLGFAPAASQKVVRGLAEKSPELTSEQLIKQALKLL